MDTYQLIVRDDFNSKSIAENYRINLESRGWKQSEKPDLVITIGGDGTMLQGFKKHYHPNANFLGIHSGTLGFYADWDLEEANKLLEKIFDETPETVSYPLIEFKIETAQGEIKEIVSLNEAVIKSKDSSTFVIEVYANEQLFEVFRGDGLIVSTPTGSTAYNFSVGGSVLHPSVEAMQIAELAAINNREFRTLGRPFVMPKHHTLDLYPKDQRKDVFVSIDGTEYDISNIRRIRARVSDNKINFVRYRDFPFWQRVKEKFIK